MSEKRTVGDLRPGDSFIWADRPVTIDHITAYPDERRPARWLHVEDRLGGPHRLHYYDDEVVATADPS